MEIMTSK